MIRPNGLRNIPPSVPVVIVRAAERAFAAAAQWSYLGDYFQADGSDTCAFASHVCDLRAGAYLEAYFRLVNFS